MNTKLTLNLNKDIIEQAKAYAKGQKTSLSNLIENYLGSLTQGFEKKSEISPLVSSLTGVIPDSIDLNGNDYQEYLSEKYS